MILEANHEKTLSRILGERIPDREVYLVGSRANGNAVRFSDIDLWIAGGPPLSPKERTRLRMALEESDLPYRTDLIEESSLSQERREEFLREGVRLR